MSKLPPGATAVTQDQIDAAQGRPFVQRMKTELSELEVKIEAANTFVKGERFAALGENEQRLLKKQIVHMEDYASTLEERISLY